eukprot:gene7653-9889_t
MSSRIKAHASTLSHQTPAEDTKDTRQRRMLAQEQHQQLTRQVEHRKTFLESAGKQHALRAKIENLQDKKVDLDASILKARQRGESIHDLELEMQDVEQKIREYQIELESLCSIQNDASFRTMFPELVVSKENHQFARGLPRTSGNLIREDLRRNMFMMKNSLYNTGSTRVDHVTFNGEDLVIKEQPVGSRFRRECERLAKLRHPNIIEVRSIFFSNNNRACIVMPYYERGN